MAEKYRWDPCVSHTGAEVQEFISEYFCQADRKVLFIAGAGFDPRSTSVAKAFAASSATLRAIFFQENRPKPTSGLMNRATANSSVLTTAISNFILVPVEIFGSDGAVIGGRNVVRALNQQDFSDLTDIVVDISALSVGTSFPIIRYLLERIGKGPNSPNLHVFVAHDPNLDAAIQSIPCDAPSFVHGFKGKSTLDMSDGAAKLWLPQLAVGRRGALGRLHEFVSPHDTCPIIPFPARDPRLGDILAEEYRTELESGWSVDTRDIVYADEEDPLDLYRTILRLDDLRKPVFEGVGGSMLVLSPLGSKVMALGALMAALERDLPVAYLESIGYNLDASVEGTFPLTHLIHIWLEGEVYPKAPASGTLESTQSQ